MYIHVFLKKKKKMQFELYNPVQNYISFFC